MGTRADFYAQTDDGMEWLGSIGWDGYPSGLPELSNVKSEIDFVNAISKLRSRDDFTQPNQGWPWPWDDSRTTDYAYLWNGEGVVVSNFGAGWQPFSDAETYTEPDGPKPDFPDMSDRKAVTYGQRSGTITFGV